MPRDLGNCYDLNYYRDKLWEVDSFCATGSWEGNEKWFRFQVYNVHVVDVLTNHCLGQ